MAGEVLLFNPRRKRRKARKARKARRVKRHRVRVHNPRKRRVARRARRHVARRRRHVRHNPAFGGGKLMQGVSFGVGAIATKVVGGIVGKWIPAAWNLDANTARIGTEALVGIGAPILARKMRLLPSNLTNAWLVGGVVVTVLDIFDTFVKPNLPMLGDYEYGQVSGYETPAELMGVAGDDGNPYGADLY